MAGLIIYDSKGRAYSEDEIAEIKEELEVRACRSASAERMEVEGSGAKFYDSNGRLRVNFKHFLFDDWGDGSSGGEAAAPVPIDLENYADPQWHTVRSQYDWRYEVDEALREVWPTFTAQQQLLIASNFDRLVREQDWE